MFATFMLALTFTILGATAFADTAPHDGGISVTDGAGHRLGSNPVISTGRRVIVTVTGFAPRAIVTVYTSGTGEERDVVADDRGTARLPFVVSALLEPGPHALTFVGAPARRGRAPQGNLQVSVPRVARFAFEVPAPDRGSGVGGGEAGHRPSRSASDGLAGDAGDGLAATGFDVARLLGAAALAVGFGLGIDRAGRRRTKRGAA